jgi:hypothetical protein
MIETLITAYLIVGCIIALVVWYTIFQPDYDEFVTEYFDERPPTLTEKWIVILTTPFVWPYSLYMALSHG